MSGEKNPEAVIRGLLVTYTPEQLRSILDEMSPRLTSIAPSNNQLSNTAEASELCASASELYTPPKTGRGRGRRANSTPPIRRQTSSGVLRRQTKVTRGERIYFCGFCQEEGIEKACTRKNDLKRHLSEFHYRNELYFCGQDGCNAAFDWPAAWKKHCKDIHGISYSKKEEDDQPVVKAVRSCSQCVFACGFESCMQVFEAGDEDSAPEALKEYLEHVVKHYIETSSGGWSYSARIHNLLRQDLTADAWQRTIQSQPQPLTWDPSKTSTLRKVLETRHFVNADQIIESAIAMSNEMDCAVPSPGTLTYRPIRDECPSCCNNVAPTIVAGGAHLDGKMSDHGALLYPEIQGYTFNRAHHPYPSPTPSYVTHSQLSPGSYMLSSAGGSPPIMGIGLSMMMGSPFPGSFNNIMAGSVVGPESEDSSMEPY